MLDRRILTTNFWGGFLGGFSGRIFGTGFRDGFSGRISGRIFGTDFRKGFWTLLGGVALEEGFPERILGSPRPFRPKRQKSSPKIFPWNVPRRSTLGNSSFDHSLPHMMATSARTSLTAVP